MAKKATKKTTKKVTKVENMKPSTINLNNEYSFTNEPLEVVYEALEKLVNDTSEHVYLCVTKGDVNQEHKWLRTEFTNEQIIEQARFLIEDAR